MSTPPWEEIDHTADWALRVRGADLRALFEHAALGMMSLLGDVPPAEVTLHETIQAQASDAESLLVKWLSELLYLIEQQGVVFSEIHVSRADGTALVAEVGGGRPSRPLRKHIKAVTYNMLAIRSTDLGFETTIVFDV
jgi:SHS2 domain-containing protein